MLISGSFKLHRARFWCEQKLNPTGSKILAYKRPSETCRVIFYAEVSKLSDKWCTWKNWKSNTQTRCAHITSQLDIHFTQSKSSLPYFSPYVYRRGPNEGFSQHKFHRRRNYYLLTYLPLHVSTLIGSSSGVVIYAFSLLNCKACQSQHLTMTL
jgi:hypothetical protein